MPTYTATVTQWVLESTVITVKADNQEDAKTAALEAAHHEEDWGFCDAGDREISWIEENTP